ncbi:cobalt ECF transporter T component CbiQ [Aquihabitans sp. G128]|uniref:cobalt ECF transporter T component CbiQ n=1 Tax=Aquihabitans sp. G128 TaxID=2849779 RepID=UPI001C24F042|nr:cobalt ECF transporter T component CbiQ [Aquihabitans sp. G128]QXC59992.1 cobalt ECF transporter T component CbiQ [Aquihabitans sp. G128]
MGAGHVHALYVHEPGRLHPLAPQAKLVGLVLFVLAVVATPREAFWAFGVLAVLVAGVALAGGLSLRRLAGRLVIEAPFLAFALFLPFVGHGPHATVAGLSLSTPGLWGAWNIVAKGTLGVAASVVVASTTPVTQLLHGLERLHLPRVVTAIAGFMVRYLDVTTGELQRLSIARQSRGHDPRWIWQARAVAASAGTLFIRSFERGERVHLAMVARGYDGTLPLLEDQRAPARDWLACLAVPATAALIACLAWTVLR